MKNSLYILLSLLVVACQAGKEAIIYNVESKDQQPNIIYILADDLGYGDVACFNPNGKIPTTNLDDMASNGIRFTDAHSSSAVCTPTRYGILTGRYNWRTSLKSFVLSGYSKALIKQERTTIAEMLKSKGYNTGFVGKWHLGWDWKITKEDTKVNRDKLHANPGVDFSAPISNGPASHGFDYSFGFSGSLDMAPYVYVEDDMPTMVPTKHTVSVDEKGFWRNGLTADDFDHATVLQDLTDKAINFIESRSTKSEPFFLYFPLPAPHTPILPTTEFLGKSNTNMYGDFVMQVDDVIGQIRSVLRAKGISENTLLVFTSDNGCSPRANYEELAEVDHDPSCNFRGTKADIFEGGHRVPFIVEWPAQALKNSKSDNQICTTDFFATCADILDYPIAETEAEDSYSMLPLINGTNNTPIREYTIHHSVNGSFAIRKDEWKLIVCPGSGGWSYPTPREIKNDKLDLPAMQLYNLKDDLGETTNLITDQVEIAEDLRIALRKIILDGRSTPGPIQDNDGMEGWTQIESIMD